MRVRLTIVIGAMATALLLSACGSSGGAASSSEEAPFEVPGEPVATTEVSLPKSYRFEPAVIEIEAGDTVTWTNEDDFPHNVHLLDGSARTVDLPIGEGSSITFGDPRTVYYECSIHPQQMHGKIIVKEG
ncbi:MAG TPA: plastocyanin/azurin family copper-binding protein [Actinomycetota bacterium]|jgi:plastocyanin|nr:plastocyanin/azurin family copper-binding protein [Actinomycetota bacterium]